MQTQEGIVIDVSDIQAPTRGKNQTDQEYQANLKKFQDEQAMGITKKVYFKGESPIEVKQKIFDEILIFGLKTKDLGIKVGDRIKVKGKPYQTLSERGFNKSALVEILTPSKK